jgi:hypothetical protein
LADDANDGGSRPETILAMTKAQPRNGTSHVNIRIGERSDLAVMKVSSGPTPIPSFKSVAATGKTTDGPAGIRRPTSQPSRMP